MQIKIKVLYLQYNNKPINTHTTMFTQKFNTQREAVNYYGHSWSYIEKHYHVSRCYDGSGFRGYFIKKN